MKDYTTITDAVLSLLANYRQTALSADLTTAVSAVKKGQYTPGSALAKPEVYVRFYRVGAVSDLAGGRSRLERLMFVISGAVVEPSQEDAHDQACNLLNNIDRVMANNATNNIWGASYMGWGYSEDEANPEVFGEISFDPGASNCVAHFKLLWSCDVRRQIEPL